MANPLSMMMQRQQQIPLQPQAQKPMQVSLPKSAYMQEPQRKGPGLLHYLAMMDDNYANQHRQAQFIQGQQNQKQHRLDQFSDQRMMSNKMKNMAMQGALEPFGDDPFLKLLETQAQHTSDWNPLIAQIGAGIAGKKKSKAQQEKEQREEEYDNRAAERDNKLRMRLFDHKLKRQQETGINTLGGVNVTNDFSGMMQGLAEVIQGDIANTGKLSPETEERLKQVEQLTAQMATPAARVEGVGKAEETLAADLGETVKTRAGLLRGKASLVRSIQTLRDYIDKGENVTGPQHALSKVPIFGDVYLAGLAPRAYELATSAVETIMPALRPALGGNFSAKEFGYAVGTVFDPALDEKTNLERMVTYNASVNSSLILVENLFKRYLPNVGDIDLMAGDFDEMKNRMLSNLDIPTREKFEQELEGIHESNANFMTTMQSTSLDAESMRKAYHHMKINGATEDQLKWFAEEWIDPAIKGDIFKSDKPSAQKEMTQFDSNINTLIKNKDAEGLEKEYERLFNLNEVSPNNEIQMVLDKIDLELRKMFGTDKLKGTGNPTIEVSKDWKVIK